MLRNNKCYAIGATSVWMIEIVLFCFLTSLLGCDKNPFQSPGAKICPSQSSWIAPALGGAAVMDVTNCGNTEDVKFVTSGSVSWLTVSPDTGITPSSISIAASNNTSGFARTGYVMLTGIGNSAQPFRLLVTQESSVSAEIEVTDGTGYAFGIAVSVDGNRYDIGPNQTVQIPVTRGEPDFCIWECPSGIDCRWDCGYFVVVGGQYKVIVDNRGPAGNMMLIPN